MYNIITPPYSGELNKCLLYRSLEDFDLSLEARESATTFARTSRSNLTRETTTGFLLAGQMCGNGPHRP